MDNISVKKVSSKTYKKRKKRLAAGVIVKKKYGLEQLKTTVFQLAISIMLCLITALLCAGATKLRALWFETLIKPPFMPSSLFFLITNAILTVLITYILFISIKTRNKAQISSLIVNSVITVLLFYMFFGLASPLGSLVVIIILISQTITIFLGSFKNKKNTAFIFIPLLIWQVYNMLIIYTVLMLN